MGKWKNFLSLVYIACIFDRHSHLQWWDQRVRHSLRSFFGLRLSSLQFIVGTSRTFHRARRSILVFIATFYGLSKYHLILRTSGLTLPWIGGLMTHEVATVSYEWYLATHDGDGREFLRHHAIMASRTTYTHIGLNTWANAQKVGDVDLRGLLWLMPRLLRPKSEIPSSITEVSCSGVRRVGSRWRHPLAFSKLAWL